MSLQPIVNKDEIPKPVPMCQHCFNKTAAKACENCGAPLCFKCYLKHKKMVDKIIKKPKIVN